MDRVNQINGKRAHYVFSLGAFLLLAGLVGFPCWASNIQQQVDAETRRTDLKVENPSGPILRASPSPVEALGEDSIDPRRDLYVAYGLDYGEPAEGPDLFLAFDEPDNRNVQPKFKAKEVGKDGSKRPWRVKLGNESFSEPVNDRIFWALGFFSDHNHHRKHVLVSWDRRYGSLNKGGANWKYLEGAVFLAAVPALDPALLTPDQRIIRERLLARYPNGGERLELSRLEIQEAWGLRTLDIKRFSNMMDGEMGKYPPLGRGIVISDLSLEVRPRKRQDKSIADNEMIRLGGWSWHRPPVRGPENISWLRALYVLHAFVSYGDTKDEQLKVFALPKPATLQAGRTTFVPGVLQWVIGFSDLGSAPQTNLSWALVDPDEPLNFRYGYKVDDPGEVFDACTMADAKKMVDLIARLTPQDLGDALAAGGYSWPRHQLAQWKLLVRRDQLVWIFRSQAPLYTRGFHHNNLNIKPEAHLWKTRSGREILLESGNVEVVGGEERVLP